MAQQKEKRSGPIAFRIRPELLEQIDARAKKAGLSRNQYMIRSALGELDDPSTLEARLDELEDRVSRIEHYQQLGG